ncbi:MAG: hypothetical protein ACXWJW_00675 [Xanthobacteraceae bacterium]
MKVGIVACAIILVSFFVAPPAQAQSKFKECAAQWNAAKAANQTEGKSYREFQKACLSKSSDLAKQAGTTDVKPGATAEKPAKPKSAKTKKSSGGREASNVRRRACGAEWKADKAAGKVPDGMKWPQYWSACNKRKKGEAA